MKFFFNILLQEVSFHDEKDLFLKNNNELLYVHECQIRRFLHNIESLHACLMQICKS
jgi:uncharacterized protein (DUF2461 family)